MEWKNEWLRDLCPRQAYLLLRTLHFFSGSSSNVSDDFCFVRVFQTAMTRKMIMQLTNIYGET